MNVLLRLLLWVLALAVVALPVVAVLGGWVGADRWPLARLRVHAPMAQVSAEQVQSIVLPYAQTGYFAVDLQGAQDALEALPWVESAKVHKLWPDVLEVTLVEHQPLARWGDDRLLSVQGKMSVHCRTWAARMRRPNRCWSCMPSPVSCLHAAASRCNGCAWMPAAAGSCAWPGTSMWCWAVTMRVAGCNVLPACCRSW